MIRRRYKMQATQVKSFEKIKSLGGYTGAMGGFYDLEKPAETILGELNPGEVFSYLFRRFGYPRHGWDDQKSLVVYYLNTPMEGVILSVHPDITGAGTFGYVLREDIDRQCTEDQFKPYTDWNDKCEAWTLETHQIEIIKIMEQDNEKLERVWKKWGADKNDVDFKDIEDAHKHFFDDQESIRNKYINLYKGIEPFPATVAPQDQDKNTTMKQGYQALCATIEDLKRPVFVRDVLINITGQVRSIDFDEADVLLISDQAGMGTGTKLDPILKKK